MNTRKRGKLESYLDAHLRQAGLPVIGSVVTRLNALLGTDAIKDKAVAYEALARLRGPVNPGDKAKALKNKALSISKSESIEFYSSPEWRRLRYRAIIKYGRRCVCCGTTKGQVHVDHIKPRSKFTNLALDIRNLQVLCEDCNMGKGAWDQTDWRGQS